MNLQHERITTLCAELRLGGLSTHYPVAAQRAVEAAASYPDFLETLMRAEPDIRRARTRNMLAKVAGFPSVKALDQYDFEFATGAPRPQIMQLAGLGFVERAENVTLLSPSGVEKPTWLSRSAIWRRRPVATPGSPRPPTWCCSSRRRSARAGSGGAAPGGAALSAAGDR